MKHFFSFATAFLLCLSVLFYAVIVIAGYVFDNVHSYGGPTPMALDTAISLSALAVAGAILSSLGVRRFVR